MNFRGMVEQIVVWRDVGGSRILRFGQRQRGSQPARCYRGTRMSLLTGRLDRRLLNNCSDGEV